VAEREWKAYLRQEKQKQWEATVEERKAGPHHMTPRSSINEGLKPRSTTLWTTQQLGPDEETRVSYVFDDMT